MTFTSHKVLSLALISVSLALSWTPVYTARPWIRRGYCIMRGVPVYAPACAGTVYSPRTAYSSHVVA